MFLYKNLGIVLARRKERAQMRHCGVRSTKSVVMRANAAENRALHDAFTAR
jgi:hypothetical protein